MCGPNLKLTYDFCIMTLLTETKYMLKFEFTEKFDDSRRTIIDKIDCLDALVVRVNTYILF